MNNDLIIGALLTCYNRREKTISCLENLFDASLPTGYKIKVFLVDDGSTDGTSDAVKSKFPEVNIISGTGELYWNRGMNLAWNHAAKVNPDYYLWLNDDTKIEKNSINKLLEISDSKDNKSIICGTCKSEISGKLTYGGYSLKSRGKIIANEKVEKCDYFNGNIVLVPKYVYNLAGNLDPVFNHSLGDYDYGLRAKKLNIDSWVTDIPIACCENNDLPKWCNPKFPLKTRLKFLYTPLGVAPFTYFIYAKRHFGLFEAIRRFIFQHIRVLLPGLWT